MENQNPIRDDERKDPHRFIKIELLVSALQLFHNGVKKFVCIYACNLAMSRVSSLPIKIPSTPIESSEISSKSS